ETQNFVVYWYGKSRSSAQFCIEIAESENSQVQKLFEYHLKDKIELVIYADASDHAQSNINLDGMINDKTWDLEPKIKDHKILLYFNGKHEDLRNLLRSGITQLYFNSMFSGTALQDVVQKVISLRLPEWFEQGLIQYLAYGWKETDQLTFYEQWKQKKFRKMSKRHPTLAGKSFWHYLTTHYGEQAISNWLYMTRIQKDIVVAAKLVFNQTFDELQSEWYSYYKNQEPKGPTLNQIDPTSILLKLRPEEYISSFYNRDAEPHYVITTQQNGKARVRTIDKISHKRKTIFKYGSRSKLQKTDLNYPIFLQDGKTETSYIFYEKRNRVYVQLTEKGQRETSTIQLPEDIRRVYSAAVLNSKDLILSANTNGYSDLLIYNLKSRQFQKITNDIWDDLDVSVQTRNQELEIAFRSNRPRADDVTTRMDTLLPLNPFRIYSFLLDEKYQIKEKKQLAEIRDLSIHSWKPFHQNQYITSALDVDRQRWFIQEADKNYEILFPHLPLHLYSHSDQEDLYTIGRYRKKWWIHSNNKNQLLRSSSDIKAPLRSEEDKSDISDTTERTLNSDTLYFQSPFGNPNNIMEILAEFDTKKSKEQYRPRYSFVSSKNIPYPNTIDFNSNLAIAYRDRYRIEDLSTTVDNEILFSGLNTFSGTGQDYQEPPLGILLKAQVSEIFENKSLEAGIRIPTNFNGLEAFMLYENRKKRYDHGFASYFRTQTEVTGNTFSSSLKRQSNTFLVNHQLKYPLDQYRSIRAISTIRNDHVFYLSTNPGTLEDSIDHYQQRIGTRLEFVFDNALDVSLNIKNGWQAKVYFEVAKRFELNPKSKTRFLPGALFISGFDIRYHIPVFRKSVFANRGYLHASFGRDRILYHVGGTENWLLPKHELQNPLETSGHYAYTALITEVRSYGYGARKAGSVAGFSSELRIPFLQYILNQNWKNSVLRNFQFILFLDAATVWDGLIPEPGKSSTLDYYAENPVVKVNLQYTRNPYIAGTGMGLRTALFGYFIRYDRAWSLDPKQDRKATNSISLGLDF
ncbi:MAG TPA: hypothetical protein VFX48_01220, partial [Saprospiraceae bacterium]|nr:hypothetical protein [Saprospiraceae bacterium]